MEIERLNPDGLAGQPFYHHVVRSSSLMIEIEATAASD